MTGAWVGFGATVLLVISLIFGWLGTAKSAEMRDCLEAGPYQIERSDPLWSVWAGSDLLQIEDEADVDQCYDPLGDDSAVYRTERSRRAGVPSGRAKMFKTRTGTSNARGSGMKGTTRRVRLSRRQKDDAIIRYVDANKSDPFAARRAESRLKNGLFDFDKGEAHVYG